MSGETYAVPGTSPDHDPSDLTLFQHDILVELASSVDQRDYGLGIKRHLQEHYDDEVNHGRLYPNLDELVDLGLVEKEPKDRRTNWYKLTDAGARLLRRDLERREAAVESLPGVSS